MLTLIAVTSDVTAICEAITMVAFLVFLYFVSRDYI
jgi:hypothetical protein